MKTIPLDHYDMARWGEMEFAKLAELATRFGEKPLSEGDLERLDDKDFGLIVVASDGSRARVFPITNKFEVTMSKAAAIANAARIPAGARNILNDRLAAAARRFLPGMQKTVKVERPVPSNIFALSPRDELHLRRDTAMQKTASRFAITESYNGGELHRYPIDTAEQVARRIRRFETTHPKMHIKYAFEYARNIAARAEELGVSIPRDSAINLYKTASLNPYARRHINDRLKFAPPEAHAAYLGLMLKTASATPEQIAVALDATDRQYALDSWYGVHYPNAAASVLDFRKTAEIWNINGVEINASEFKRMLEEDEDVFKKFMDEDAVKELKKNPKAVLLSLPAPHRQKVLEILTERSS